MYGNGNATADLEPRHYFAQLQAYQIMPDEEMFSIQEVMLHTPVEAIISRPSVRVSCHVCGEEIMNEREIWQEGLTLVAHARGMDIISSPLAAIFKRVCLSDPTPTDKSD